MTCEQCGKQSPCNFALYDTCDKACGRYCSRLCANNDAWGPRFKTWRVERVKAAGNGGGG